MHLTPTQVWQLREIARGHGTFTNLKKWDNRALGGMFRREFFRLDARCNATITQLGWDVYQKTTTGVMRKNWVLSSSNKHICEKRGDAMPDWSMFTGEQSVELFIPSKHPMALKFRWRTMEGKQLRINEMETRHVFNCLKMCFNHIALAHGMEPVWHTKNYNDYNWYARHEPDKLALLVVFFYQIIEERGDLHPMYQEPYAQIVAQLTGRKMIHV